MARPQIVLLLALALPLAEGWLAAAGPRRGVTARPLRAGSVFAAEEDTWSFGDAADDVSTATTEAIEGEERELTEKEKEIARLRAAEVFMKKDTGDAKCQVCNYVYKWEEGSMPQVPKKTPWELVPNSYTCPQCKSPKPFFDPIQIEIAGFADNQAYGFGTNTWTEAQKSTAIFGGLAAFFALLLGGYALCACATPHGTRGGARAEGRALESLCAGTEERRARRARGRVPLFCVCGRCRPTAAAAERPRAQTSAEPSYDVIHALALNL